MSTKSKADTKRARLNQQLGEYEEENETQSGIVGALIGIVGTEGAAEVVDQAIREGKDIEILYPKPNVDDGMNYRLVEK